MAEMNANLPLPLGEPAWRLIDQLRHERRTGRSARMLYEVLGDMWVVQRNPFLQDDLLENRRRRGMLIDALRHRLRAIEDRRDRSRAERDSRVGALLDGTRAAVAAFEREFEDAVALRRRARRLRRIECPFVVITPDGEDWMAEYLRRANDGGIERVLV